MSRTWFHSSGGGMPKLSTIVVLPTLLKELTIVIKRRLLISVSFCLQGRHINSIQKQRRHMDRKAFFEHVSSLVERDRHHPRFLRLFVSRGPWKGRILCFRWWTKSAKTRYPQWFERLCPIISRASILRTMPVAFISVKLICFNKLDCL